MGNQRFGRKGGGFKRHKTRNGSVTVQRGGKSRRVDDEIARGASPSTSGDSHEEDPVVDSEDDAEAVVNKEPSMYDNLLKTLGSGNQFLARAYKKRQREEEGKSDTEEDMDSDAEAVSLSEEAEGEDGTDGELPTSLVGISEHDDDAGTDNDDEASDMDEEDDLRANCQSPLETSTSMSSFDEHLGYELKGEVDNLSEGKLKYRWEVPALDMSNCKWIGTREFFQKEVDMKSGYGLTLKLYKHWLEIYDASGFHESKQRSFFSLCNSYMDILHHNKKPFYLKGMEEDSSTMDAYIMHSLNHIFRTRDLVRKNDKLAKHQESARDELLNKDKKDKVAMHQERAKDERFFLDQGFTRPKVLFLLPLASIALRVVKRLIQLTPSKHKANVEQIDRFYEYDDFGAGDEHENSKVSKSSKPSDFEALFGGNNNDHFMIGIKFTRGSIKLYSDFYSSDMIVASPLGLITKIGEAEVEKEKSVDYLSSIEVLVVDHADVIAMQNWSHVSSVVDQLNRIPSKVIKTDIMRIRPWYSEGQAQFYRQTIILSSYLNPDMNALFNRQCVNYRGKVKLVCKHKGVLPKVMLPVQQFYERFDAESVEDADDARLEHFSKKVFPKIKDSVQGGTMLFISSYFEFVRIRNFLKSQDASFCLLGEYTKQSDISRARIWFFEGKRNIMLYTERAHFYHRYKIRGIKNLIIYSLPERKEFYPEIVNMLEESDGMRCSVLYSRFDQLRLERIVGTDMAKRMAVSEKAMFAIK